MFYTIEALDKKKLKKFKGRGESNLEDVNITSLKENIVSHMLMFITE